MTERRRLSLAAAGVLAILLVQIGLTVWLAGRIERAADIVAEANRPDEAFHGVTIEEPALAIARETCRAARRAAEEARKARCGAPGADLLDCLPDRAASAPGAAARDPCA